MSKAFLFQAIRFSQTVLIQTIQFGTSIVFVQTQLNVQAVLFQAIQFSTQFTSILPLDRTLSGATTPGQSGPGSDGNEEVLRIPQSSSIIGTSPSDSLVSYPGHLLEGSYPSAGLKSVYSTAPPSRLSNGRVSWNGMKWRKDTKRRVKLLRRKFITMEIRN